MKTERRHELETNDLSDWLSRVIQDIKPYSKLITAVAVLLAVGIVLINFGAAQRRKNAAFAWTELFRIQVDAGTTMDPQARSDYVDQLAALAERDQDTPVAGWALQYAGDISLALGSDKLWEDRAAANERFQTAAEHYEQAFAKAAADNDILRQRALLGLAQTQEALNNFAEAKSTYQQVMDQWPDSYTAQTASDRLEFLNQPSTKEFYGWLLRQEPPGPPQSTQAQSSAPGAAIPSIPGVIPSTNDSFSVGPPTSSAIPDPAVGTAGEIDTAAELDFDAALDPTSSELDSVPPVESADDSATLVPGDQPDANDSQDAP